MTSPNFGHAFEHIPGLFYGTLSSFFGPLLLFAEVSGDKGLRNATRFFWNAKKITMEAVGVSFTQYGTHSSHPTTDEAQMHPPPTRAVGAVDWMEYGDGYWSADFAYWVDGTSTYHVGFSFGHIYYLTDVSRYAVGFGLGAGATGTSDGDSWGEDVEYFSAPPGDTWVATDPVSLPDCLEVPSGGAGFYSNVYGDGPGPSGVTLGVEWWTYA